MCVCRQTVFYTPDTLKVSKGEEIIGELACSPNARNPRDLDIKIEYQGPGEDKAEVQYKMCVVPFRVLFFFFFFFFGFVGVDSISGVFLSLFFWFGLGKVVERTLTVYRS